MSVLKKHTVALVLPLLAFAFFYKPMMSGSLFFGFDGQMQQLPWKTFVYEAIRRGELPLWNPHVLLGIPFIEGMQCGALYPPQLLFLLMAPERAMNILLGLHIALAGLGMYALVFRLSRSRAGALLSGVSYMLCGMITTRILAGHFALIIQIALFPWMFLFAALATEKNCLRRACMAGMLWGCALLAGHPQMPYYMALFTMAYFLLCAGKPGPRGERMIPTLRGLAFALAFGFAGIVVAAPQVLPSLKFHAFAARADAYFGFAVSGSMPLTAWLTMLLPTLFGDELGIKRYTFWSYWESNYYIGLAPLIFALAVGVGRNKRRIEKFFIASVIVAVLLSAGRYMFFFRFIYDHVPLISDFRVPARALIIVAFCGPVMAGLWFTPLRQRALASGKRRWTPFFLAGAAALFFCALLYITGAGAPAWDWLQNRSVLAAARMTIGPKELPGGEYTPLPVNPARIFAFYSVIPGLIIAAAFLIIYLPILFRPRARRFAFAALIMLTAADLCVLGFRYADVYDGPSMYRWNPRPVEFMKNNPEPVRIITSYNDFGLFSNTSMMHGIDAIGGYDTTITKWFNHYFNYSQENKSDYVNAGYLATGRLPHMLSYLNIKYVLDSPNKIHCLPGLKRVFADGQMQIFELPGPVTPRAILTHSAINIPAEADMMKRLDEFDYDPRREIYFDEPLDASIAAALAKVKPSDIDPEKEYAKFTHRGINSIDLDVNAEAPGFLFVSDAYYPGWKATVDGNPAEVLRANFICRAVFVPKGRHVVKMFYTEPLLTFGLLLGIAMTAALLMPNTFTRRQ